MSSEGRKPEEKLTTGQTQAGATPPVQVFPTITPSVSTTVAPRTAQLAGTPPLSSYHDWAGDRPRHHLFNSSQGTVDTSSTLACPVVTTAPAFHSTTPVTSTTTPASRTASNNSVTQAIAAGLMNQGHQGYSPSANSATNPTPQQFQKLKVEDALSYLDQVKFQFGNQPQVYNDFLDIMKEFKSQSIDTPGVIQRVSHLFNGHPDLIVGFNTFLPPGYKIEVSGNDQISVTGPNMIPQNISQIGLGTLPMQQTQIQVHTPNGVKILPPAPISAASNSPAHAPAIPTTAISATIPPSFNSARPPISSAVSSPITAGNTPSVASIPPIVTVATVTTTVGAAAALASSHTIASLQSGAQIAASNNSPSSLASRNSGGGAAAANSSSGASNNSAAQPVEFNHAINYVNKIKNRFHGQPDIYKSFLDILHKYQKEQRNIKDSNGSYTPTLSETQVYNQVARLFQNDEDLLKEFGQFLPDANGNFSQGFVPSASTAPLNPITTPSQSSVQKPSSALPVSIKSEPTSAIITTGVTTSSSSSSTTTAGAGSTTTTKKTSLTAATTPVTSTTTSSRSTSDSISSSSSKPSTKPASSVTPSQPQQSTSSSGIKRPAPSATSSAHIPNPKKVRSCILRDVTLTEASKLGTLQEFAYFDKVRKALRCQEAYDNFLRCLLLYNNEIIGKTELVYLVQTYLSKWKDLFSWFKNFLGIKDNHNTEDLTTPPRLQQQLKDKHEGMAMEIDYTSLSRLGFSYRALPSSYQQPKCSGRDELCRKVLNDRWVSFPTFSEDSTFVNSKKSLFEEHIYRCEDERYEMDVVLEINLAAQKFLEYLNRKLKNMSQEELGRFRFDSQFNPTNDDSKTTPEISETTLKKALRRLYGEYSKEIYAKLRQDPKTTIHYVLKRIKLKDEEWRTHHRNFQKQWKIQSEKYYLKSLDHQGPVFKQSDIKYIRSKALVNELESLYDERLEAIESGSSLSPVTGPHLRVTYEDKATIDDAASLIIHHVKRQQTINSDDKEKIRHIVYQFLPDLYFAPRGNQASDDDDDDEDEDDSDREDKGSKNAFFKSNGDSFPGWSPNDNLEGHYHLFMGNNYFYLFFRLHHLLCERLLHMSRISEKLIAEDENEKKDRKNEEAMAELLCLAPKRDTESKGDLYACFLDFTRQLLDGNIDSSVFEDKMREKFTIYGYVTFTIDKLITNIVRQLQHIVTDDTCIALLELYKSEEHNQATGGTIASQHRRVQIEAQYQRKSEHLTATGNCMKINVHQKNNKQLMVGIELVDTECNENPDATEYSKWSEYLEQYANVTENDISDELREKLEEKPVFLQRNANQLRATARNAEEDDQPATFIHEGLEVNFKPHSYKLNYVPNTCDIMYRKARITCKTIEDRQRPIAEKLCKKFSDWHEKWEHENVSRDTAKQTNNWLMGKVTGLLSQTTSMTCEKDQVLPRNIYKVEINSNKSK